MTSKPCLLTEIPQRASILGIESLNSDAIELAFVLLRGALLIMLTGLVLFAYKQAWGRE